MSDTVLSVIPADPRWQPPPAQAERARRLLAQLASQDPDRLDCELRVEWHDAVTVADCGENLERIGCLLCVAEIDTEWWGDLLEERCDEGFDDLSLAAFDR